MEILQDVVGFLLELIKSIRAATSEHFLIGVRISPKIEKAGIYLEDSLELAKILCQTEIDMLHIGVMLGCIRKSRMRRQRGKRY